MTNSNFFEKKCPNAFSVIYLNHMIVDHKKRENSLMVSDKYGNEVGCCRITRNGQKPCRYPNQMAQQEKWPQEDTCAQLCPEDMRMNNNGNQACVCIDTNKIVDPETGKCTKNVCEDGKEWVGGAGNTG